MLNTVETQDCNFSDFSFSLALLYIVLMFLCQETAFQNYCMLTENGQGFGKNNKKTKITLRNNYFLRFWAESS